jgi:hypothetical protein
VVFGEEIEFDRSTDCNSEAVGAILENTAVSDGDLDGSSRLSVDRCSRDGDETKEGIGELHYDLLVADC